MIHVGITGLDADVVLASIALAIDKRGEDLVRVPPKEYEVANCAERVVKLILGGTKLSYQWWGIM